jgi:hypothetical protein
MSEERIPSRMVLITLVMIFISGCWTVATLTPFPMKSNFRPYSIATITTANIAFLLSLLTSTLSYAKIGDQTKMKRITVYLFNIGIVFLIASIILFSASYITTTQPYYPD